MRYEIRLNQLEREVTRIEAKRKDIQEQIDELETKDDLVENGCLLQYMWFDISGKKRKNKIDRITLLRKKISLTDEIINIREKQVEIVEGAMNCL